MKKSAHEIWKKALNEKLSDNDYKELLKKEGLIVEKSKEEIRSMFMDKINAPKNIDEMFEKSMQKLSTNWNNLDKNFICGMQDISMKDKCFEQCEECKHIGKNN